MLVALLVTYVVRVALTIVLIAGAPLALMFHALPQTEGIAYWWWKAFGGCLAIQVGQSPDVDHRDEGVPRPRRVHHVRPDLSGPGEPPASRSR